MAAGFGLGFVFGAGAALGVIGSGELVVAVLDKGWLRFKPPRPEAFAGAGMEAWVLLLITLRAMAARAWAFARKASAAPPEPSDTTHLAPFPRFAMSSSSCATPI